jgi:hypothetical protein
MNPEETTPEVVELDLKKPLFARLREWAQATHPNLPWDDFVPPSADQDECLFALFTFLEENGVELDESGLIEGTSAPIAPDEVGKAKREIELKLYCWFNREFFEKLKACAHEVAEDFMRSTPMQD